MNTSTASSSLPGLTVAAIFTALASIFAVACAADDAAKPPTETVKYADLAITTPQGAAVLYARIRGAAQRVCQPRMQNDLVSLARAEACARKAIEDAVTKVNEPALFAVYNSKFGTQLPAPLVSENH